MPLSDEAKQSLDNSARISNERKAKKQAEGIQQEGDRRQAENDYNAFVKEQADIQKQIDIYEAEDKIIQDQILAKQQAEQKIIDDRNAMKLPYETKLNEIEANKNIALSQVPLTYQQEKWVGSGGGFVQNDGTDIKIYETKYYTRSQRNEMSNTILRSYSSQTEEVKREYSARSQAFEFNIQYPNAVLGRSALNRVKGGASIEEAYKKQENNLEAKRQAQRQTAINQSQSQLKNDSAKWQNEISTLAQEKESNDKAFNSKIIFNSTPTKAGDLKEKATLPARELFQVEQERPLNLAGLKSYQATQQAKAEKLNEVMQSRQKIEVIERPQPIQNKSNAFLTKAPVYGSSIIGTNVKQSDKAVYTFEETQQQQADLFQKIKNAPNSKEATRLKEEAQAKNPYVGTPQLARTKQGTATQGVLIDLKLNIKKEDTILETAIEQPKARPTDPTTVTTWNVQIGDRTITGIKDEETANKLMERFNRTEEQKATPIEFLKDGAPYKPTTAELWNYTSSLIDVDPPVPTKADQILSNYRRDNPQAEEGQLSGEITNPLDEGFTKGFLDSGTELSASVQNIAKPDGQKLIIPETFEGALMSDLVGQGSNLVGIRNDEGKQYTEAKLSDYVKEKIKTPQGIEELGGSVFGMVAVNYGLLKVLQAPKIIKTAYETNIKSPQTKKIAEEIAERIKIHGRDPAMENWIAKHPKLTAKEKELFRSVSNTETVGIEMLDSRTALIKRGTELNEVNTPYIVVRNTGKKTRHGELYETFTEERPGAYSKILISGEQGSELKGGVKQSKDIIEYKATRDNIIKSQDISKLATVGTSEKVGLQGLRETPIAVIEKIETQEIKSGSIIMETERLNKIKSMNQQVKGLNQIDDINPSNTKPFKPDTTTPSNKINVDLPKGKQNITVTKEGATQKRETLESIIKSSHKESINLKTNSLNKLSGISIITSTQATRSIQGTGATQRQNTQQAQEITTQQTQKTEIKTGLESGSKLRTEEITGLKSDLETLQKTKPTIDPKYSLITKPGLNDKQQTIPLLGSELDQPLKQDSTFELVLKQEQLLRTPTPTKTTTITTRPGLAPTLNIKTELERNNKPRGGKLKIGFYRYNVNTDSVGRYIEQAPDISTGKTMKTITRIDQLERRINTPQYARKQTKREQKQYKKEMQTSKKASGSLESRMYIPNISEPKGKKAQKQLKKLGFKLNIF